MFLKTKEEMHFEKNGPNSPDFQKKNLNHQISTTCSSK